MKLNKLLTSLSALSILGSVTIPLSSCGPKSTTESGPITPEGGKTKETTSGASDFKLKFKEKPDDSKAEVTLNDSTGLLKLKYLIIAILIIKLQFMFLLV